MIQEAKQNYRGVLCLHCRQPIPLPAAVTRREAERKVEQVVSVLDLGPRVLTLRCKACQGEALYAEGKFIDCEGTPRTRYSQARKTSPMGRVPGNLSRAANG